MKKANILILIAAVLIASSACEKFSDGGPIRNADNYRGVGLEPRRILVVSFLYPESYYVKQYKGIIHRLRNKGINVKGSRLECSVFSPGFLHPEDFVEQIARKIESARLEGRPFTGVLLDGLHNVFLSFPVLQKRQMVWPMLYRILAINRLTIVTTFTTFVLDLRKEQSEEEQEILLKGHAPLLHALVQAADFYLSFEKLPKPIEKADCVVAVRQCIGKQKIPYGSLLWNSVYGQLLGHFKGELREQLFLDLKHSGNEDFVTGKEKIL